ncbi:MAG: hypothetical protein LBK08_02865, partial [Treponema sp.]|nr:hypothetical protein [Treponema sp.]
METAQTAGEGLTFEKVWAALMENREQMKATDRRIEATAEQMKATDRRIEATDRQMKETDRQMKATDRRLGELANRFGDMVEYMVLPNLVTKFEELQFTFTRANRTEIKDRKHGI